MLTRECTMMLPICADDPGRFGVFASCCCPDVDGSLREIAQLRWTNQADGIGLLDDDDRNIRRSGVRASCFDELNRRNAVVRLHPPSARRHAHAHHIEVPAATLDFLFALTEGCPPACYSAGLSPLLRHRLHSHAGGTIPSPAERIAVSVSALRVSSQCLRGVMFRTEALFFDTALLADQFAFSVLLKLVAPNRFCSAATILFVPETTITVLVKGLSNLGLPRDVLHAIERAMLSSCLKKSRWSCDCGIVCQTSMRRQRKHIATESSFNGDSPWLLLRSRTFSRCLPSPNLRAAARLTFAA